MHGAAEIILQFHQILRLVRNSDLKNTGEKSLNWYRQYKSDSAIFRTHPNTFRLQNRHPILEKLFVWKNTTFRVRLSPKISYNDIPATKNHILPLPNIASITKNAFYTSPFSFTPLFSKHQFSTPLFSTPLLYSLFLYSLILYSPPHSPLLLYSLHLLSLLLYSLVNYFLLLYFLNLDSLFLYSLSYFSLFFSKSLFSDFYLFFIPLFFIPLFSLILKIP